MTWMSIVSVFAGAVIVAGVPIWIADRIWAAGFESGWNARDRLFPARAIIPEPSIN